MAVSWFYVKHFVWILDIWTRYLDQDNFEPGVQSDFKSEVCSVHLSGLGQTRGRPGKFQTFLFPPFITLLTDGLHCEFIWTFSYIVLQYKYKKYKLVPERTFCNEELENLDHDIL